MHQDLDSIHDDYLRIRERILKQLEGISPDSEQAKFLHSELEIINKKLLGLQGLYSAYHHRSFIFVQWHFLFCFSAFNNNKIRMGRSIFYPTTLCLNRLSALKALLQSLLQAEDVIKVHEARLTEKETSSLDLRELAHYRDTLKVCYLSLKKNNFFFFFLVFISCEPSYIYKDVIKLWNKIIVVTARSRS